MQRLLRVLLLGTSALTFGARADIMLINTGSPDGLLGMASRPGGGAASGPNQETEAADDFIVPSPFTLKGGSFDMLIPQSFSASDIQQVTVEIYRVFPKDSATPPSGNVPTRVNSPADVAFAERDSTTGALTLAATLMGPLTVANTVDQGINPLPNFHTGGEGPATGTWVRVAFSLPTTIQLPPDHYFFVPQLLLNDPTAHALWLSAPKPIVGGTGPFTPDLQVWMRNASLDPDWLRVGSDIIGTRPANGSFTLTGTAVPEPSTVILFGIVALVTASAGRRRIARRRR